jgi:hypothetical protein
MEREELRTLPMNHEWTPQTLGETFAAILGGVAHPGKRPGFAVVAGLCHPRAKDDLEIHVLGEVESVDLGELLRACRGLGQKYRPAGMEQGDAFRWLGNGQHVGAREIISQLNAETKGEYGSDWLTIQTTPILDMEQANPYSYLFSVLRALTKDGHKRLHLHGSKATLAMTELPPDEIADAKFGTLPAVEALAFAVRALQDWLRCFEDRPREDRDDRYNSMWCF